MSRKRDNLGRFSAGTGGSALQQFGREDTSFKRPRTVQSSMPGYPGRVGEFGAAGQAPPTAGALGAGYSSGVIDMASNSTSSLPVSARPWSARCCVGDFSPGSLLFVRKDLEHASYKSVADLATANWLLRDARDALAVVGGSPAGAMGAGSHNKENGWLHDKGGWNYFGLLRNSMKPPGSLVTLMNTDVFGRSRVGNLFGSKIVTGDRVGLALVPFNIQNYREIVGPGSGSTNPDTYVRSLTTDSATTTQKTQNAVDVMLDQPGSYDSDKTGKPVYTVWQWMPTLNKKLCKHVWSLFDSTAGVEPDVDFVDHVAIGCVSNALMSGKSVESHMIRALQSTDAYTTLPQIEIIIE